MAMEAPLSRYKRNNFIIYTLACLALAFWFGYDGYFNKSFIQEHSDEQGKPDSTLVFNQKAPPFLFGAAVLLVAYYLAIRSRKVAAAETELVVAGKERIPYDAIEKIDKTYFEKKGFFTITYHGPNGREIQRRLSEREYDNLKPILDHLIAKIT